MSIKVVRHIEHIENIGHQKVAKFKFVNSGPLRIDSEFSTMIALDVLIIHAVALETFAARVQRSSIWKVMNFCYFCICIISFSSFLNKGVCVCVCVGGVGSDFIFMPVQNMYGFFEEICSSDVQKMSGNLCANPINTERFPFYPCMHRLPRKRLKNLTYYLW